MRKTALLTGTALGLTMIAATPAQAACGIFGNPIVSAVSCGTTTTTDTTRVNNNPASDRNYDVNTSAGDFTGTVLAGATVDGFGLAFTNVAGGNSLNVVNDGVIASANATAGGTATLNITGIGATNLNYSGTGSILNLGLGGTADGLVMNHSGTGNITATVGGSITTVSDSGFGLAAIHEGTAGNISLTTAVNTTISAGSIGIAAFQNNAAGTGTITLTNNSAIGSRGAALNTLAVGISSGSSGLGAVSITNNGAIGRADDRTTVSGISAFIENTASAAALSVTGSGAIFTSGIGIEATHDGTGTVTVNYTGAIDTTGLRGVDIRSSGGAINATLGAVSATSGTAINARQAAAGGGGAISITTGAGAVSGAFGITATNEGTGGVTVTTGTGLVTGTGGSAIDVTQSNAAAAGNVVVTVGAGGATGIDDDAVRVTSAGTGNIIADIGGDITAASAGSNGISLIKSGTAGSINLTTAASATIRAGAFGIATVNAGAGATTITNSASILSAAGAPNTLRAGIFASNSGTGAVSIANSGAIGSATDRVLTIGVGASNATASAAAINVTGTGAIFTVGTGLAVNSGAGTTTVNYTGAIDSTGTGVDVFSHGGAINATLGAVTAGVGTAISVAQTTAAGNGAISLTTGAGSVSGAAGIFVDNAGTGGVTVTTGTGLVTSTAGRAIAATLTNAAAAGNVLVTVGAGGATATLGDAVTASTAGTGTVTVNSSGPVSSDFSGIVTSATTGDTAINITGGSVTGSGDGEDAINATATTGTIAVTLSGGADLTGNDDSIELRSGGAKTVTIGLGSVLTSDFGVFSSGAGSTTISNGGTINSAQFAVSSSSATTINNLATGIMTGAISLSNVNDAIANAGTINVNTVFQFGGGADTLTNNVGGILNIAAATSILGLETLTNAGTINAASGMLFDGGATALTNTGTFNLTGALDMGLGADTLTNGVGGVLNVGAGTSFLGVETFANAGTVNAASGMLFDGGATTLTNTGRIDLAGALDMGAGADTFANSGTGILNLTGDASLLGVETFTQTGRINLNTFTLTGTGAFTNSGTIDTNGAAGLAGFTAFTNAGTLDLAAGIFTAPAGVFTNSGTIIADEGASTIGGNVGLANSGAIKLSDGATGDVLTIVGGFTGSGGSNLNLDVSATAADRLVITGIAVGTTVINVTPVGGAVINSSGILVVDTAGSSTNAFTLGNTAGTGLIDLSLRRVGEDFFLFGAPNTNALDPLALGNLSQDMWYQSADVYAGYAAQRRGDAKDGLGVWGQLYLNRDNRGDAKKQSVFGNDTVVNSNIKTKRHGAQAGLDYRFGGAVIGLTGGYQNADAEMDATPGGFDAKSYNIGGYAIFGSDSGLYGGLLIKRDRSKVGLTNAALDGVGKLTVKSTGIEGEAGYRWDLGSSRLDLGGGLAWLRSKYEDFAVAGIAYDFDTTTSLRGRLGARVELPGRIGPYVDARLLHEFKGESEIALTSGGESDTLEARGRGTWGRIELGVGGNRGSGLTVAAWGEFGSVRGLGLHAGYRF